MTATLPTPRPVIEPLPTLDLDHMTIPPLRYLVPEWIVEGEIIGVAGPPKIGKTTLLAHMIVALSAGVASCISRAPAAPEPVWWLDCEQGKIGTARLFTRLGAPTPHLHITAGEYASLRDRSSQQRIEATIHHLKPRLVVLDAWSSLNPGARENDSQEASALMQKIQQWRDTYHLSFAIIMHSRKSPRDGAPDDDVQSIRGSSALAASLDSIIKANPVEHGSALDFSVVARRGGGSKPSARVAYSEPEGPEGPISLVSSGTPRQSETERLYDQLLAIFPHDGAEIRRSALFDQMPDRPTEERAGKQFSDLFDRALKALDRDGAVEKTRRGYYRRLTAAPTRAEEPDELPF